MENKVRLLLVLDYINRNSGVSSVVMNYYSNIDKTKIQMDFLLYENPGEDVIRYFARHGSKVYTSGHPVKLGLSAYQKAIGDFFTEHQNEYQIVHLHIPNAAFIVLKYAKKCGVETRIIHSHNSRGADGVLKKVRNYVLNRQGVSYANQYFACSESAGKYLFGRKRMDEVTIIHNAINLEKFQFAKESRARIRQKLGIGENELLIGHVGRFSRQKNHRFLIEITKRLKAEGVNFKLMLLGGGELQEQVRAEVQRAGLAECVIFVGVVSNPKEFMDAMDVFVLPSLYEGLPCVCIEAQANGLPCLVSSAVTEEIRLSESVQFLDISDVSCWCAAISEWLDAAKRREQRKEYSCSGLRDYDIIVQSKILEERYLSYGNGSDPNVYL